MSLSTSKNISNQSSLRPINGRAAVVDGAHFTDAAVRAVCHVQGQGSDDKYFYSTTFSGGPGDADLSGAFDTPKAKCPPDGGSQICVTGKSAFSLTPDIGRISTGISIAKDPYQRNPVPISTPPLSPDDGSSTASSLSSISSFDLHAPPELVTSLFPRVGIRVAAYAKAVSVSGEGASFDGFVLDLPKTFPGANPKAAFVRTLFVDGSGAESVQLRESIVAMLDLADEHLSCQAFVIALDKTSSHLGHLIHSLMYVGGTVVTQPPFEVDRSFVLVGIDI